MTKKVPDAEEFDRILEEILDGVPASQLLTIPGFYELLSEHFNNEVLEAFAEEQEGLRERSRLV